MKRARGPNRGLSCPSVVPLPRPAEPALIVRQASNSAPMAVSRWETVGPIGELSSVKAPREITLRASARAAALYIAPAAPLPAAFI